MKSESATDLPAPGSPPSKRLRSGSPIETGFPSSSTPSESGSHNEPSGTGHGGAGDDKRVAEKDRDVGERGVGGLTHDPDVTGADGGGQRLARLLEQLGGEARRQAKAQSPSGRDRLGAFDPRDQRHGG